MQLITTDDIQVYASERLEAVLSAIMTHVPDALDRGVVDRVRAPVTIVRLDGVELWRGGWTREFRGPVSVSLGWEEAWSDSCPAEIRAAVRAPQRSLTDIAAERAAHESQ